MAPFQGPGRAEVLRLLAEGSVAARLPLTLGRYEPQAEIVVENGAWLLRELPTDHAAADAEAAERHAAGEGFLPEHTWRFKKPGKVRARGASAAALAKAIESLEWTYGP